MTRRAQRGPPEPADSGARLDKWLWAARFYRTRALSQAAITGGKVRYEGERSKPAKAVQVGARIALRQGWDEIELIVRGLSEQRGGAEQARLLYEETPESRSRRQAAAEQRRLQNLRIAAVRPDKKQRRLLEKLRRRLID